MRRLCLMLSLFAVSVLAQATTVTLKISSLDVSRKDRLYVQLCEEKDFLVRDCKFQQVQDVKNSTESLIFNNVPEGRWAAMAYHDENSNGRLDSNQLGIPVEGTAFSRNAKGHYGPPKFADAVENVAGKATELRFRLSY